MTNPWLARFAGAPALVAPHMHERFSAALSTLAARFDAEMAGQQQDGGDEFWTELGPGASRRLRPYNVKNGILELPVRGVLLHGFPYQFFDLATGYEYIGKAFDRGMADPAVTGIALIIDSPGGMVSGNFDLVDKMYAARGQKPIRAFASEYAFSAAYSIASVADKIILPRTGEVGSIGVVMTHLDISKAYEEIGFKVTFIYAGKHKVDGNAYEALPDDVKAAFQADIDYLYGIFVDTVARNRSLSPDAVRATEADTFRADEALNAGLADTVGALDEALADFAADLTNPDTGDETMSDQKAAVTVASVKADHPEVANALIAEGKDLGATDAKAGTDKAVADAVTAERQRVAKLDGFAKTYAGNAKALEIIDAAKADGSKPEDTAMKLVESGAAASAGVIGALVEDDKTAAGAKPAASADGKAPQTPEGWKAEWEASKELQAEFPTADAYVADRKYEQRKNGGAK